MKPEQQLTVNIKLWLLPSTHPGELSNNGDGLLVQLNNMLFWEVALVFFGNNTTFFHAYLYVQVVYQKGQLFLCCVHNFLFVLGKFLQFAVKFSEETWHIKCYTS